MQEEFTFSVFLCKDSRNITAREFSIKKRLNQKELEIRSKKIDKKNQQRLKSQEINKKDLEPQVDQKTSDRQIREEKTRKTKQEKIENFNKDLVLINLGNEPDAEYSRKAYEKYQEEKQKLTASISQKPLKTEYCQQAALLSYLQSHINNNKIHLNL